MEFLKVDTLETAREKLLESAKNHFIYTETRTLDNTPGCIAAEDVFAIEDVPAFRRSTVDGFAVLAADTAATGDSIPVFLTLKGHVDIGQAATISIGRGECVDVPTGGMVPDGADAVVMVEYTEPFGMDGISISKSAAYGENIVLPGEDTKIGDLLLKRGKRMTPQDIGILAACGVINVLVYVPPKVTIISTGDELVDAAQNQPCAMGKVRDINSHAIAALARKHDFDVLDTSVLPDDEAILTQAIEAAMQASDIVIVSGGSSKGKKDLTRPIFDKVSKLGVYTHGIAIKPGKPTILGYDDTTSTLLVGLPGHPVSAMMVFELLLGWVLQSVTGCRAAFAIPARLSSNIASSPGKLTCWPCQLNHEADGYIAKPIFGKSGLITTLTQADGYFTTPRNIEGLPKGHVVMVNLF